MGPDGCNSVGYRDLTLRSSYNSDYDDILSDFYVPVLTFATRYDRIAGFFSSSSLACAAKGIARFLQNNGKMRLVTSAQLSKRDTEALKEAIESPESIIERNAILNLADIDDDLMRDHVRAMAWMYAKGLLEIKIALIFDGDGNPVEAERLVQDGILHQKLGILEDTDGNLLSFSGSINESLTAWQSNLEQFKVYRHWLPGQQEYFDADLEAFSRLWENRATRARVYDLPTATKKGLIAIAPDSVDELNLGYVSPKKTFALGVSKKVTLWPHQIQAMDNWLKEKKGIFEMATGSGKTLAALACLVRVSDETESLLVVISTPYNHLSRQWLGEIEGLGLYDETLIVDSTNPRWPSKLKEISRNLRMGIVENAVLLTTHNTLSSKKFIDLLMELDTSLMLVVDEVHSAGSPERKRGFSEKFEYRLGLSATPARHLDDEGTTAILDYFRGVVYVFGLREAMNTINPNTGRTYLCPYVYNPIFISLTNAEHQKYIDETSKIRKAFYAAKENEEIARQFELLCIKRQNIVKNAENKYIAFRNLIAKLDPSNLQYCLVYVNPAQKTKVQDHLLAEGIKPHKFTEDEGTKPEKRFGGISEREYLLGQLGNGTLQALVSMRCLDEGVDVPPARLGIILASSGNPREYIQRRGRLLRRYPGKERSEIYDFIVVPREETVDELEKQILRREVKRYREFASLATNKTECLEMIDRLLEKLGMEAHENEKEENQ